MASVVSLKKLKVSDITYFFHWWRDKDILRLTSGRLKRMSDQEVRKSFEKMIKNKKDTHYLIILNNKVIGHIALISENNSWFEVLIIIGNKECWNKGYGTRAIKQLIRKAKRMELIKYILRLGPLILEQLELMRNVVFKR